MCDLALLYTGGTALMALIFYCCCSLYEKSSVDVMTYLPLRRHSEFYGCQYGDAIDDDFESSGEG